jgi:hypothetical protein
MLAQILAGIGALGVLGVAVAHKNNRAPVTAEIKAQLLALLASNDAASWQAYISAIDTPNFRKWLPQVRLIRSAQLQIYQTKYAEDVRALYLAALKSGVPGTLTQVANSLKAKFPELATNLRDAASIFGA